MAKQSRQIKGIAQVCDGAELLNSAQAAALLGVSLEVIRQAVARENLCPAKLGTNLVFTRRDLVRWQKRALEHAVVAELSAGAHPLDIYLQNPGRYRLEDVSALLHTWARVAGCWIVEGPRGSYARWLLRLGLVRVTPTQLRRLIEQLCQDPDAAKRAGLELDVARTQKSAAVG